MLTACSPGAETRGWRTGAAEALPAAVAFVPVDGDGDGFDEVLRIDADGIHSVQGTTPTSGEFQRFALREDRQEVAIATGAGRTDRSAPQVVVTINAEGAMEVLREASPRGQVTSLHYDGPRLFIARFTDDRMVEGSWLNSAAPVARVSMGMRQVPWGDGGVAIGRLYGDEPRSDGDLRLRSADGTEVVKPGLRGVRALERVVLPTNHNTATDDVLAVCDGWHYAYGREGDARLALLTGPTLDTSRTIGWLRGSYTCEQVIVVPGDGPPALVVRGSHAVHLLQRDDLGWTDTPVLPVTETAQIAVVREAEGTFIYVGGDKSVRIPLERAP